MIPHTLSEIEAAIAKLEKPLGELRRRRRAMLGGFASGKARQRHDRNEQICAYYYKISGGRFGYGKLVPTANKFGLSVRQISRILRADAAEQGGGPRGYPPR